MKNKILYSFQPILVLIGLVVSEKKIKMYKLTDNTDDANKDRQQRMPSVDNTSYDLLGQVS